MLILVFLHLLAIVSILLIEIPVMLKLLSILLVIYLSVIAIRQSVLLASDSSIIKMSSTAKGKSQLELKNGAVHQANLISAQWLFEYFVVIIFKNNRRKYKTVIAKDTLSQEQFYALRLYLRSLNTLR